MRLVELLHEEFDFCARSLGSLPVESIEIEIVTNQTRNGICNKSCDDLTTTSYKFLINDCQQTSLVTL